MGEDGDPELNPCQWTNDPFLWTLLLAVVTLVIIIRMMQVEEYVRVEIGDSENDQPSLLRRCWNFVCCTCYCIFRCPVRCWNFVCCICYCIYRCFVRFMAEIRILCVDVKRIFIWLLHKPIRRYCRRKMPPILKMPLHEDEPKEVFGQGDSGYNSFRVPALVYHRGTFLAFCEARRTSFRDWGSHMDLVLRRGRLIRDEKEREKKEIEWGDIQVVASISGLRAMNPVPIVDQDTDTIVLLFNAFPIELSQADLIQGEKYQQRVYVTRSTDDGMTWSPPSDITNQTLDRMKPPPLIYASGPGHGLQLKSGRLIVPGNIYWKDKVTTTRGWLAELKWSIMEFFDSFHGSKNCSNVLFSDDGGENWQVGGNIPCVTDENGEEIPANECQAAELEEGHVYLNSRTCHASATRQESYSIDGGISFTMGELSELPEPGYFLSKWIPTVKNFGGCQASVLSFEPPNDLPPKEHDAERWILFSNPASAYTRVNMSVRYSRDACQTWSPPLSLNSGPSAYSDLTSYRARDPATGQDVLKFACMYECGSLHPYERIAFQTFSLNELMRHNKTP